MQDWAGTLDLVDISFLASSSLHSAESSGKSLVTTNTEEHFTQLIPSPWGLRRRVSYHLVNLTSCFFWVTFARSWLQISVCSWAQSLELLSFLSLITPLVFVLIQSHGSECHLQWWITNVHIQLRPLLELQIMYSTAHLTFSLRYLIGITTLTKN